MAGTIRSIETIRCQPRVWYSSDSAWARNTTYSRGMKMVVTMIPPCAQIATHVIPCSWNVDRLVV